MIGLNWFSRSQPIFVFAKCSTNIINTMKVPMHWNAIFFCILKKFVNGSLSLYMVEQVNCDVWFSAYF